MTNDKIFDIINSKALEKGISFEQYCELCSYPAWNIVLQAFNSLRKYEKGIDFGFILLSYTESYKDILKQNHYYRNKRSAFCLILIMLDKADMWEEYLSAWTQIWENTKIREYCSAHCKNANGKCSSEYLICQDERSDYIHFLSGFEYRKRVIERKIRRQKNNKKIGNMLHDTEFDLTKNERMERIDRINHIFKTNIA